MTLIFCLLVARVGFDAPLGDIDILVTVMPDNGVTFFCGASMVDTSMLVTAMLVLLVATCLVLGLMEAIPMLLGDICIGFDFDSSRFAPFFCFELPLISIGS